MAYLMFAIPTLLSPAFSCLTSPGASSPACDDGCITCTCEEKTGLPCRCCGTSGGSSGDEAHQCDSTKSTAPSGPVCASYRCPCGKEDSWFSPGFDDHTCGEFRSAFLTPDNAGQMSHLPAFIPFPSPAPPDPPPERIPAA